MIEAGIGLAVHGHHAAVEGDTGEQALGPGVGVYLRGESGIRGAGSLAAQGTNGDGGIRTEREFAASDSFDAFAGGEDQHHIDGLHAELPAEAEAADGDEGRVAPLAVCIAHEQYALAAAATDEQCASGHIWNDGDALSATQQRVWNAQFRQGLHFVENVYREQGAGFFGRSSDGGRLGEAVGRSHRRDREEGGGQQASDRETGPGRQRQVSKGERHEGSGQ